MEECSTASSQEDSTYGLMHHLNDMSLPVNRNGVHRPSTSDKGDLQCSIIHDTRATSDAESVGSLHDPEAGNHGLERVVSSIDEEIGRSSCHCEMDDQYWLPPEPEDYVDDIEGSVSNYDDDDDECGDGISWGKPSSLSIFGDERTGTDKFKEETQKAMEEVMNGKFKGLVDQLLKSVGVFSSGEDGNSWVDIVTSLSWEAATFVKPDAAEGKPMDPDGYVKFKCIASGFPRQR